MTYLERRFEDLKELPFGTLVSVDGEPGVLLKVTRTQKSAVIYFHKLCSNIKKNKILGYWACTRCRTITEDKLNKYQKMAYADFREKYGL